MKREDFIEWSIQASLDCEEMENTQEKAKALAKVLGVEIQDGWYHVGDLITMDGNPWVDQKEFLEIVKYYALDVLTN